MRGRKPTVTGVLALGVSSLEGLLSALQRPRGLFQVLPPPCSPPGCSTLPQPFCPL